MITKLVLISGQRGSGKSTLAALLRLAIKRTGAECEEVLFSHDMNLVREIFDLKQDHRRLGNKSLTIIVPNTPEKFIDCWPGDSLKVWLDCDDHTRRERTMHRADSSGHDPRPSVDSLRGYDLAFDTSTCPPSQIAAKILAEPYFRR